MELALPQNLYIETYGCQMNINDSEVVASILQNERNYEICKEIEKADLILLNTCSVRENAENKVFQRLSAIKKLKKSKSNLLIGVIGCMAERLKDQLLKEDIAVDVVAGPDSYRSMPSLIDIAKNSKDAINVLLSETETYDDILPLRTTHNGLSAFVSIMRGCNNFCTYCIVPYTRGRERSRDHISILNEIEKLSQNGYKEVTLLGQNVNSYSIEHEGEKIGFPGLLEMAAQTAPNMRIRYTTSHPKDLNRELLEVMARNKNICDYIHLPVQAGSTNVLKKMKRGYTREWYIERIDLIKEILPEASISTDILSGFCGETDQDHKETLSIMEYARYDTAFMFKYSVRPGTLAHKKFEDDVPDDIKTKRLNEIISLQRKISEENNLSDIGKTFEVLVEGASKKSIDDLCGRNSQNKMVVFPKGNAKAGDFINVQITEASSATLKGVIV